MMPTAIVGVGCQYYYVTCSCSWFTETP